MADVADYLSAAAARARREKGKRKGECYVLELTQWRPEIMERIAGTPQDPFYDDARIGNFVERVCELW